MSDNDNPVGQGDEEPSFHSSSFHEARLVRMRAVAVVSVAVSPTCCGDAENASKRRGTPEDVVGRVQGEEPERVGGKLGGGDDQVSEGARQAAGAGVLAEFTCPSAVISLHAPHLLAVCVALPRVNE